MTAGDDPSSPARTTRQLAMLTALAHALERLQAMEPMLQLIVECTAKLLRVSHVSVRLLEPSGTRLLTVVRAGESLHDDREVVFVRGEGLIGWIAEQSRSLRTGRADQDPRFAIKSELTGKIGSFLGAPLIAAGRCIGVLSAVHPDEGQFDEHDEEVATLVAAICAPRVQAARLERLSGVDPLTGALNRRGFDRQFPEVRAVAENPAAPISVAMVDVDHFKRVNDEFGHAVGDEVLKAVKQILGEALRAGDAVVRYGGEEFLLVLPEVDLDGALKVAQRARCAVEEAILYPELEDLRVTISIGVAQRRPEESRDDVVARADRAMYRAKAAGRNRVIAADSV